MLESETVTSLLSAQTDTIYIAYSGGMDSHVLLHLSCSIAEIKSKITAVYVHHGLQFEADQWTRHCQSVALTLGVKFQCINVNAQNLTGQSPEEAARDARYGALKPLVGKNDVLLVAQHREDQLETVLLQLFRGAGIQGLSGMPLVNDFATGKICRPFLNISKRALNEYAEKNQLSWVEDPSNQCDDYDRNFLRNQIIPQLTQRWPGLDKTVSRAASHCADSQKLIEEISGQLLNQLFDQTDQTLNITRLFKLEKEKMHLVLRQWFKCKQMRMPTEKNLKNIVNEVVLAKADANPEIRIQGHSIRRYREKLYCLKQEHINKDRKEKTWPQGLTQLKINKQQKLTLLDASEGIPKALWDKAEVSIRFRKGAEKIKLPWREGQHSLKKLFQENAIPPWERSNIPLIYLNGNLAAIADLWISADFYSADEETCYQLKLLSRVSDTF